MARPALKLELLTEGENNRVVGWWSKGHHEPLRFAQLISAELRRPIGEGRIFFTYWRVAKEDGEEVYFEETSAKTKKAFKVTYYKLD